jgi:hypothetical protein
VCPLRGATHAGSPRRSDSADEDEPDVRRVVPFNSALAGADRVLKAHIVGHKSQLKRPSFENLECRPLMSSLYLVLDDRGDSDMLADHGFFCLE